MRPFKLFISVAAMHLLLCVAQSYFRAIAPIPPPTFLSFAADHKKNSGSNSPTKPQHYQPANGPARPNTSKPLQDVETARHVGKLSSIVYARGAAMLIAGKFVAAGTGVAGV